MNFFSSINRRSVYFIKPYLIQKLKNFKSYESQHNSKAREMKAVEEAHEESEDPLTFEQNHGQRSISDERLDLLFCRFLYLIQYRRCKT